MDFVDRLFFHLCCKKLSRICFLCLFIDFLFLLRFDNDEMSFECISRILRKFFFTQLLTFVPLLFKDLSVLHKFVNSTMKTAASIKSDLFKLIRHMHNHFSLNCMADTFSLPGLSTKSHIFSIACLIA